MPRLRAPALLWLVLGLLLAHGAARALLPDPVLFGDERGYLPFALMDDAAGARGILPGQLRFEHRPQLVSRVFAQRLDLLPDDSGASASELLARAEEAFERDGARAFRRVEPLQIGLALVLLALTHTLALRLGLSPRGALVAAALVGLQPTLFFHAHALWAELLHAVLLGLGFLALAGAERRAETGGDARWDSTLAFAAAGAAFGYALLAKGTLAPLVPLFLGVALWRGWRRAHSVRALLPPAALAAGVLLILVPQLVANARAGHGVRLSANRWWNLELGLRALPAPDPERLAAARAAGLEPSEERWLPYQRASLEYMAAADTPEERERRARERLWSDLRERGPATVLAAQLTKYARMLLGAETSLAQALGAQHRWGEVGVGPALRWLDRLALLGLLLLGLLGLSRARAAGGLHVYLLVFLAGLFAAGLLVPFKVRFLVPALPVLALYAPFALPAFRPGLRAGIDEEALKPLSSRG